jgi:hypothetical protein
MPRLRGEQYHRIDHRGDKRERGDVHGPKLVDGTMKEIAHGASRDRNPDLPVGCF